MILKRLYNPKLAQASYLIGCPARGHALVVDPNRDADQYVREAAAEGLRITHVAETHIHADFVSGSRELVERTGARLLLSDEGGESWKYAFAAEYDSVLLKDGDSFQVGCVVVDVIHTPGHTPEHLSFLVTDGATADRPIGMLSGDFVFVGDVGRPDLLERVVRMEGTMEVAARTLYRSIQRFKRLPDDLQVWPGHGAGSACGKGISAIPQSTVGYERSYNWALAAGDEETFLAGVLEGQPDPPRYFSQMKRVNREGPPVLGGFRRPPRVAESRLPRVLESGCMLIDVRAAADFGAGHVPGTINIPLGRGFPTWAGWLLPYDRDLFLIVDDRFPESVDEAARDLALIGLDRVRGYFGAEAVEGLSSSGRASQMVPRISAAELAARLRTGDAAVVDVRSAAEWEAGHLSGAIHLPVGSLPDRLGEIPRDRPVVVHCQTGARSAIAASVLQAAGFEQVMDLPGGYQEWEARGLPTERPAGADAPAAHR